ncbi:MAG: nitrite reductase, copper-containing [Rhodanobacter sp.]|nr:MAG: nitrite reductase, copper-containing [Rhodanobacter sp.]
MGTAGTGALLLGLGGLAVQQRAVAAEKTLAATSPAHDDISGTILRADTVVADPTRLPPPIQRAHSIHHEIALEAREVRASLDSGIEFMYMTWDGQVPGPMIRVRQGDTVTLTVTSAKTNFMPHNVDMHAIYGTGGGAGATLVNPGQSRSVFFKCEYPGAFIYHCAVFDMDLHISSGMYGMILVEPYEGLAKVDREIYLGQNEVYTKEPFGTKGVAHFDNTSMAAEDPTYVLFNGAVNALTPSRFGPIKARVGETMRVFMVCGGPNLGSNFHPIGNVWKECWPQGALANPPLRYIQTQPVAPGSCFVGHLDLPVPETVKLVDHALSRVTHKGLLAEIAVSGLAQPDIYRAISQ